jgi:undecaprenyl-diphosphatase
MSDLYADLMLGFAHAPVLLFITLIGTLLFGRSLFFQTAYLLSLDILLNVALKGTFKIPLSLSLHTIGYAFPSGHMQMATVFYLWWAFVISSWFYRVIVPFVLIGIGSALIHYGCHNSYDVISGFFVGSCLASGYYLLTKYNQYFYWIAGVSSCLMIYNVLVYAVIPYHASIAYGALIILRFSEKIALQKVKLN